VTLSGNGPFSFESGTTYFLSSTLSSIGQITFNGNAILKCGTTNSAAITIDGGPIICNGSASYPTVITSDNDDSYGEQFSWSTHNPAASLVYRAMYLHIPSPTPLTFTGLKVRYAKGGLMIYGNSGTNCTLSGCAFEESPTNQYAVGANGCQVNLSNSTICHIGTPIFLGSGGSFVGSLTDVCACTAPSITSQPAATSTCQWGSATFSVTASGTSPLSYQWRINGTSIVGATASSFVTNNVLATSGGNYSVVVSNACGSATSANAALTISPAITSQPISQSLNSGTTLNLSVTATGTPTLTYQWSHDGGIIAGATSSTYSKVGVQAGDAGNYTVVVGNLAGQVTSSPANVTVVVLPPPVITVQPVSQTVNPGANVTLSVTANGVAPLSYQWALEGVNLAGATGSALALVNVQPGNAGTYAVVVTCGGSLVTSANAVVTLVSTSWLTQFFGANYQTNPNADSTADPDADGWLNFEEYQQGSDPTKTELTVTARKTTCEDKIYFDVTNLSGRSLEGGSFDLFVYFDGLHKTQFAPLKPWEAGDTLPNGSTRVFTLCTSDHSITNSYCSVAHQASGLVATSQKFRIAQGNELARLCKNTTQITNPNGGPPQSLPTTSTMGGAESRVDDFYKPSDPPEYVDSACPKRGFKNVYAVKQWHGIFGPRSEAWGSPTASMCGNGDDQCQTAAGPIVNPDGTKYLRLQASGGGTGHYIYRDLDYPTNGSIFRDCSVNQTNGRTTFLASDTGTAAFGREAIRDVRLQDLPAIYKAKVAEYLKCLAGLPGPNGPTTLTPIFTDGSAPSMTWNYQWSYSSDCLISGSAYCSGHCSGFVRLDLATGAYSCSYDYYNETGGDCDGYTQTAVWQAKTETESVTVDSAQVTSSRTWSDTSSRNGHDGDNWGSSHGTVTYSEPYTSGEVNAAVDNLLASWNLLDDTEYPWRADSRLSCGPLVTYNERGATPPSVDFDLTNVGTAETPDWRPPLDNRPVPWPSQSEGCVLGAPLPVHVNGEPRTYQPYFNFYHNNYTFEETERGHPQALYESSGAFSPFPNATQWVDDDWARILPAGPFWAYGSGGQDHFTFRLRNPYVTETTGATTGDVGEWEEGGISACLIKCKWAETIDAPTPPSKDFVFKSWEFNFRDFIESYRSCAQTYYRNNVVNPQRSAAALPLCPALGACTPVRYTPIEAGYATANFIGNGSTWISAMNCLPQHCDYDCCRPAIFVQPNSFGAGCNGLFVQMPPAICDEHYGSLWMGRVDQATSDVHACDNYVVNRNNGIPNPSDSDPQIGLDLVWHEVNKAYEIFVQPLSFARGDGSSDLHMQVVSRDKFFAGSFEIPSEMKLFEVEFVNVSSGENLGRYGDLLGGGLTRIYNSVEEILSDADLASGGQSTSQKVWFIRSPDNSRKLDFYACFNTTGLIQVNAFNNGRRVTAQRHTLVPAQDFAFWINYVDNWVRGVGFEFGVVPLPAQAFTFSGFPNPASSGQIHNLTPACLIPMFNVVAQVEGLAAVSLGVFEGVKSGLRDDWELVMTIKAGGVLAGNWAWSEAEAELLQWRDDPVKRALQFKQALERIAIDGVFTPLQSVQQDLSTWDGFKQRSWATWKAIQGGAAKVWTVGVNFTQQIADGACSWLDDFNGRMLQGGERVAFQNTPWAQGLLLADLGEEGRQTAYTFGYVFGYCSEQVTVGVLTGGAFKVAQIMLKGGVVLTGNLSSKVLVQIAARSHLLKKQLASVALSNELRLAIDRGLVAATKMPTSSTIQDSAAVVVESHLSKVIVNRNLFNLKVLVEAAVEMPNTRKLFEQTGTEWVLYHRFALFMSLVGDAADHTMLNRFLKLFNERLIVREANGTYVEWTENFLRSLEGILGRFETRPPLTALDANQLARLQELLRPGGSIWTSPPIGPTTRGVIAEVHLASTEYRGWRWSPTGEAVDFFKDGVAVQLTTTSSSSATSTLKTAIDRLFDTGTAQGATLFKLDVRKLPGLDTSQIEAALRDYVYNEYPDLVDKFIFSIREYAFVQN